MENKLNETVLKDIEETKDLLDLLMNGFDTGKDCKTLDEIRREVIRLSSDVLDCLDKDRDSDTPRDRAARIKFCGDCFVKIGEGMQKAEREFRMLENLEDLSTFTTYK